MKKKKQKQIPIQICNQVYRLHRLKKEDNNQNKGKNQY